MTASVSALDPGARLHSLGAAPWVVAPALPRTQSFDEIRALMIWAAGRGDTERDLAVAFARERGGGDHELVVLQTLAGLSRDQARSCLRAYLRGGGQIDTIAQWLRLAGRVLRRRPGTAPVAAVAAAGDVVDELGDAAQWVVDAFEAGADAVLSSLETFIDALIAAGIVIATVVERAKSWSVTQMADLVEGLLKAGFTVGEFIIGIYQWTYDQATTFVMGCLQAGLTAADLLARAIEGSYFAFRRVVTGLFAALGGVGQILEWALSQAEGVGSLIWRTTMLALRFAGAVMTAVLDWAIARGTDVFAAVLWAWESIGEALITVYGWARTVGEWVWEAVAEVTVRMGNNVYYLLNYVVDDFLPGMFNAVRGCLKAGFAYAGLIAWALEQAIEVTIEVVRAALAVGTTIVDLLVALIERPAGAARILVRSLLAIGTTLADLFMAVFVDTAIELLEEVVDALLEFGQGVADILAAVWEVEAGRISLVVQLLFNYIPGYRPLTDSEIADARTVFGDTLNYQTIFVSRASASNAVIFGLQDFFNGTPDSRAFVTGRLVNFDVVDPNDPDPVAIERCTLIHELTHVWQHDATGPVYMADALVAQTAGTGYNYGYQTAQLSAAAPWLLPVDGAGTTMSITDIGFWVGVGGDAALNAAGGDFAAFNREQQGQILMHWFVRDQLVVTDLAGTPIALNTAAWQPYRDAVRGGAVPSAPRLQPAGAV